jgi:hypothetical protein
MSSTLQAVSFFYTIVSIVFAPTFYFIAWDFAFYNPKRRRLVAALTLFAPVTIALLPFITAVALLYALCRGIAKLIGIVAGEE